MDATGIAPRKAALDLICAVTERGRLLSELLPRALEDLPQDERARAQRLATETLRWASRSDRVLGPYLRNRPYARVHNLLRMAVYEICAEGAAAHGVVNSAVEIMKGTDTHRRHAGLVNAVLRKVAANAVDWEALPMPVLPKWLRKPLLADFGKATVAEIERAHAQSAPLDLTPKGDGAALAARLGGVLLPTGSVRLSDPGQVSKLAGYAEGEWWVQDAAAALPAQVLDVRPGERVLDMCAAPGGKTLQMAAAGAVVTALDVSERRMTRVEENLSRTGLTAERVVADAREWQPEDTFDAILLDAPCSATGTLRRHPDLLFAKDGSEFPALFELQSSLIDKALDLLKPGGRLVYCTCSLLIDEGEEQLRDALARHSGVTVNAAALRRPGIDAGWIDGEGGLRLRPDFWAEQGGMDGFYIARLEKSG
ncbi:MAG: RsmB/NOP family class I SAM-dependent RNA methyltransferase [Pseudomonadota bacterium]